MTGLRLVVDANVVIAAMMRDSTTRRLLVLGGHELHVPGYLFGEVERHLEELVARSGISEGALLEVLQTLRAHMVEHAAAEYRESLEPAKELLAGRDIKDVPYVALALYIGADGLWSEDQGLKSSGGVTVYRTSDLAVPAP